jgi:hypothetical protein
MTGVIAPIAASQNIFDQKTPKSNLSVKHTVGGAAQANLHSRYGAPRL